ncbi:MAG: hypothetical protein ACHQIO_23490, partial [Nevskiales bacterium]
MQAIQSIIGLTGDVRDPHRLRWVSLRSTHQPPSDFSQADNTVALKIAVALVRNGILWGQQFGFLSYPFLRGSSAAGSSYA